MIRDPRDESPPPAPARAPVTPPWGRYGLLGLAWTGLLTVALLVVLIGARPSRAPGVIDLSGPWRATVIDQERTFTLDLPGLWMRHGVPSDARVTLAREIAVNRTEPLAVWIDRPLYAVRVLWDGEELASSGNPDAVGPAARSSRSVLALLPREAPDSTHLLELDMRGDYGQGGTTGRVLLGTLEGIHRTGWALENQRLAVALGMSLLAFLPLAVSARQPWRTSYLYFGLFATSLAVLSFAQSNTIYELLPQAIHNLRIRRVALGPLPGLLLAMTASHLHGHTRAVERGFLVVGLGSSVLGLVAPGGWLHGLEVFQDATVVLGTGWYGWLLTAGIRDQRPGAWWLLVLTLGPVIYGVLSEITLTHGMRSGTSHLFAAALLFAGGSAAILVLRDTEAAWRQEALVGQSSDALVVVGADGRVHDCSVSARRLLRGGVGANLLSWVDPADRPTVRAHMERARHRADRVEFRLATARDRVVESLGTPFVGDRAMLVLRDVTQRHQQSRWLLHAARMETVAVLLGGIAHDFNNMLGTLLAHIGFLRTSADNPKVVERLDRMEGSIERASHLTRRLLTVARGTGSEHGPVDVVEVCRNAVDLVEPTLPDGVRLTTVIADDLVPAHGNVTDLEQVLVNLLVNARDALQGEGTITVIARRFALDAERRSQGVVLVVEDDGPGIPDDLRDEVFEPFVTTKGRGTGLGLAVASRILDEHHGRIWYEHRPGGGARFLVALRHADVLDDAPAPLPEGRKVLLVEDEEVLLESFALALRESGYEVTCFTRSNEAAAWLRLHRPDILVTDVVMDELSGIELASLCTELHADTPVLLVSGFIPDESLVAMSGGAWQRLNKPVRPARLVATVGRVRRRAERAERGDTDVTRVSYAFAPLEVLTGANIGL